MKQQQSDPAHEESEAHPPSVSPYEINIRVYLDALSEGKYVILLITFAVTLMAMLYLVMASPIYTSNVLMQFMDKGNSSAMLGEISDALVTKNSVVDAEMEIIRSRRILGSAVEQLKLNIIIEPKTLPVIDWGRAKPCWSDCGVVIDLLESGSKYTGKKLTLISISNEKYKLLDPDGSLLFEGRVGERQVIGESGNKQGLSPTGIDLLVSALDAEAGTEFSLTKKPLLRSLEDLSKELTIKEEGKETSILRLSMEGENPQHIANILNTIVENYLAYNVGRKAREIQHIIDFVQKETALSKKKLEQAETALVDYLFSHNSAGLSSEVTKLMSRLTSIESQITELEIQKVGTQSKYTKNHPVVLTITRKIDLLESEKIDIDKRLKLLPEEEREKEAMLRDVEAAKQLYLLLQSKEQELGVALSGITNTIEIIDPAQVSSIPIKPQRLLVIGKGIILGLFLGLFYVIGRRALRS